MNKLSLVLFAGLLSLTTQADILFNVDFENPPHVLGQAPTTGMAPDRPFDTQLTVVDSGIAGFSGQVGRFTSDGVNAYSVFALSSAMSSGIHSIIWEASMLTFDASDGLQVGMTIGEGGGTANDLITLFLTSGNIVVFDPGDGGNGETIGTWSTGQVFQFQALLNLNNDTYDYFLNGNQVIYGQSLQTDASISTAVFQRPFVTSEFAFDNFRWEIVPEPSTISLLLVGVAGMLWRRKRRG